MNIYSHDKDQYSINVKIQQPQEEIFEVDSFIIRKSDLDDAQEIQKLITKEQRNALNLLYDYPEFTTLFERNYISVSILDSNQKLIGCAVFNDYPQGSFGTIDFKHENFWEYWLYDSFDLKKQQDINSYRSIWMNTLYIAKHINNLSKEEEVRLIQRIFQHIFGTLPDIHYILFLHRGEALDNNDANEMIINVINEMFTLSPTKNRELLKTVRGIQPDSNLYFSHRDRSCDLVQIRLAHEEDHDDLAAIFNSQSEVLTAQFGEFFIADLIATQNKTRNNTKFNKNSGKALVAEVDKKAVGLMSLSTEIDYQLLSQNFELDMFDNLFKGELMDCIRQRLTEQVEEKQWQQEVELRSKIRQQKEETMVCKMIGQRMFLQQFCIEREADIKQQIENYVNNEHQAQNLTPGAVEKLIDSWLQSFKFNQPSKIFLEFPSDDHDLQCLIQTERSFFLETLTYFGLPKNYMKGEGHWKDWEKKKLEEQKAANMRNPLKKKAAGNKQKKAMEDKQKELLKPPSYFDLQPLLNAFSKFVSSTPEYRAQFIRQIEENKKKFIQVFTKESGEMNDGRCVDLNKVGKQLVNLGCNVHSSIQENMSSVLECFGEIQSELKVVQVIPQSEESKEKAGNKGTKDAYKKLIELKEEKKPIDVIYKLVSYDEFIFSLKIMKEYDLMMNRLKLTKSPTYAEEVALLLEREEYQRQQQEQARRRSRTDSLYRDLVKDVSEQKPIPSQIPGECQNAFVINLFCIDENYESRSQDFLDYAFKLFPHRDYIIITQPHTIPENTLLQKFIQVPKKRNSNFEHCLYIMHKDSLAISDIIVRKSQVDDIDRIQPYLEGLKHQELIKKDINEAIRENASKKTAFSVYCQDELIGVYILSKTVNLDYYVSHFCVQDHIILKEHPFHSHTRLLHSILNPLFQKSVRYIIKEILRLTNKTCLYFETHERSLLPDIFNELYLVRARNFPYLLKRKWDYEHDPEFFEIKGDKRDVQDGERDPFDQEEPPFSLSMVSKKYLSQVRQSNNSRIIVVGASDTGISLIESLLTIRDVNFTYLTLLAPGGLITNNLQNSSDFLKAMSTNYTINEIKSLMLDARITLLDAKMMTLDKKVKRIGLDKNASLPYDILISSVGLIDNEIQNRYLISTGVYQTSGYLGYKDKECKIGVYSIDDPYLYHHFRVTGVRESNIDLLTRKKSPKNITIYGRTLHTICFINGLLNRGVSGERIILVIPPRTFAKKTSFSSNQERLEYEVNKISDPDPFEDEIIEQKIFDTIEKLGVQIYRDHTIEYIETDSRNVCQTLYIKKFNTEMEVTKPAENQYDKNIATQTGKIILNSHQITQKQEIPEAVLKKMHQQQQLKQLLQQQKQQQLQGNGQQSNQNVIDSNKQIHQENGGDHHQNSHQHTDGTINNSEQIEEEEDYLTVINTRFIVTSGIIDIDREIFNVIHENGLVYNGRLIVKNNFQTTDPAIFACGKICEFSQRYKQQAAGQSLRQDKYNGRELGQKLAKSILEQLGLGYLFEGPISAESEELPQLNLPIGQVGLLPRNLIYYNIKKNDFFKPQITIRAEKNRENIYSDNLKEDEGMYIKFSFDNNGLIEQVTYLGHEQVNVNSLISFLGLSEKYLNQLDIRYKDGLIPNISEFLSENWAMTLYHEWFSEFRQLIKQDILQISELKEIIDEAGQRARSGEFLDQEFYEQMKKKITFQIRKMVQDGTLEFIRENQNHLPMYYVPFKKVENQ